MNWQLGCFIGVFVLSLVGCAAPNDSERDTPVSGNIRIGIDETLRPVMERQLMTFQAQYDRATLSPSYDNENTLIEALRNDTFSVIVIADTLTSAEQAAFIAQKRVPETVPIAYDALAFIVDPQTPLSQLKFKAIQQIMAGQITDWAALTEGKKQGNLRLVFDNPQSGTANYLLETLGLDSLPAGSYALKNNQAVIEYILENDGAIGIVGLNWLSDTDDTKVKKWRQGLRILALSPRGESTNSYEQPSQDAIQRKVYPFIRQVNIIHTESRAGLGVGFAAFVASDKGQRILLKAGLLPERMPERLINIIQKSPFQ